MTQPEMRLLWSDEFDQPSGTPPDPRWWSYEVGGGGWGNGERQVYSDAIANACHDGQGNLVIRALAGEAGYSSARLITKGLVAFQYGRLEARMLLPRGAGLWPALWLLGSTIDTEPWPACGEIDVMEHVGSEPRRVFGTVHCPQHSGRDGISGALVGTEELADRYHVFAVDWSDRRITWSMDGVDYFSLSPEELGKSWVFDHPFYILLNLAVGGWLGGEVPAATHFPAELKVDYVRIFAPPA